MENSLGRSSNVELYEKNYREYFGANRMMMEARLKALDYKLLNAKYPWADYVTEQKQRVSERRTNSNTTSEKSGAAKELRRYVWQICF